MIYYLRDSTGGNWNTNIYRKFVQVITAGLLGIVLTSEGANATTLTYVDHYPYYSPGVVQWAMIDGEFNTEIYGDPFGGGRFDKETIANSLRSPTYLSRAKMTTRPARDPRNDSHRVVLVFNPVGVPDSHAMCGAADQVRIGASGGGLRVMGAFCAGKEVVSTAYATGPAAGSPDDPAFQSTMNMLLTEMLPSKDPNEGP